MTKNKKLALNSRIQTYQILTNDDEVCIPSLSRILIANIFQHFFFRAAKNARKGMPHYLASTDIIRCLLCQNQWQRYVQK